MFSGVPAVFLRFTVASLVISLAVHLGCESPETFHRNASNSTVASGGFSGTGGAVGSGGDGTGGMTFGTGGMGSGGFLQTGGAGTGGAGTGGAATGGKATGGTTGTGGASMGGMAGGGGRGGFGGAGGGGTAGATGGGGRGMGGMPNGGGGAGIGGNTGSGPCMGLCAGATSVPPNTNSGALGTATTCHEVVGTITGVVCGNFAAPRTLSINGTVVNCGGGNMPLPAKKNGGYCLQSTAGNYSYAYFATY